MAVMIWQVGVLLCALALCVQGQFLRPGECPYNVKGQADFDISRFTGVWYDALKYWTILDITITCPSSNYTLLSHDKLAFVKFFKMMDFGAAIVGAAQFCRSDPTKLIITHPNGNPIAFAVHVMYADYQDFAVLWACQHGFILYHLEYLWVVTRERVASAETIDRARAKVVDLGIDPNQLYIVDQRHCKVDPERDDRSLLGAKRTGLIF